MKKLILTISFIFISGICSAQVSIDSIKGYWNGNLIDSIYLKYTSSIPNKKSSFVRAGAQGIIGGGISFFGCSTSVAIQNDTMFHLHNDSISVPPGYFFTFGIGWDTSSICSLPVRSFLITFRNLFPPLVTSIETFENLESKIRIIPNPVRDYFTVDIPVFVQIEQIVLVDLQGRLVKSYQYSKTSLDINGVANGVYFLKITTNEGLALKKLIVN